MYISKLHSILAVVIAHNNKSQICYCGQISLQSAAVNCSFSDNMTPLWGITYFAADGTFANVSMAHKFYCQYHLCRVFIHINVGRG